VLWLLALVPDQVRLFPVWLTHAIGIVVLVPIAAVWLTAGNVRWARVERAGVFLFSWSKEPPTSQLWHT
jgi:hypothetical protein